MKKAKAVKSSRQKQTKSRRPVREFGNGAPIVLDVEVIFSTHVHQHVAVPLQPEPKVSEWTREDVTLAAKEAALLLPRRDALLVDGLEWSDREGLSFSIGGHDGDLPYIRVVVRGCPYATFARFFDGDCRLNYVTALFAAAPLIVREARETTPVGEPIALGTIRDEYPRNEGRGDVFEQMKRRDAERLAATQAARRIAGQPLLPRTRDLNPQRTKKRA
jgi:hypothetical protein